MLPISAVNRQTGMMAWRPNPVIASTSGNWTVHLNDKTAMEIIDCMTKQRPQSQSQTVSLCERDLNAKGSRRASITFIACIRDTGGRYHIWANNTKWYWSLNSWWLKGGSLIDSQSLRPQKAIINQFRMGLCILAAINAHLLGLVLEPASCTC